MKPQIRKPLIKKALYTTFTKQGRKYMLVLNVSETECEIKIYSHERELAFLKSKIFPIEEAIAMIER